MTLIWKLKVIVEVEKEDSPRRRGGAEKIFETRRKGGNGGKESPVEKDFVRRKGETRQCRVSTLGFFTVRRFTGHDINRYFSRNPMCCAFALLDKERNGDIMFY